MKYLVGIAFVLILGALAAAGVFMLRGSKTDAKKSRHMARALAVRVALSVSLFLLILLSWPMGWIQPTGMPLQR